MPRRGTPADLLVVGLGNPGAEYARSRHNVGFDVVDVLVDRCGERLRKGREKAMVAELRLGGARVVVAQPLTFMNLSGDSVGLLVRRFGVADALDRLVVVHDELDLPPGRVRVKSGGGLAGHNGLRSIVAHVHSQDFVRIRIGVGKPPTPEQGADHVLSKVSRSERELLSDAVERAADAVEVIAGDGLDEAMRRYNGT